MCLVCTYAAAVLSFMLPPPTGCCLAWLPSCFETARRHNSVSTFRYGTSGLKCTVPFSVHTRMPCRVRSGRIGFPAAQRLRSNCPAVFAHAATMIRISEMRSACLDMSVALDRGWDGVKLLGQGVGGASLTYSGQRPQDFIPPG